MTTEWRWVDIDGSENVVGAEGLGRMLRSGALPPYTLVWKTTWLAWHRASEVPELATALGRTVAGARLVPSSPSATTPPPPPVDRYADLPSRPASLLGSEARPHPGAPPARPAPPRPPSLVPSTVRGPAAPPANKPGRSTLIGMVPRGKPPEPPAPPAPGAAGAFPRSTMIGMTPRPPAPPAPIPPPPAPIPPPPAPAPGPDIPPSPKAPVVAAAAAPPHAMEPSAVPTGPIPIRDVQPTLTEEDDDRSHSHTLRPVGAAPPPPRAAPQFVAEPSPISLAGAPTDPAPAKVLAELAARPASPMEAASAAPGVTGDTAGAGGSAGFAPATPGAAPHPRVRRRRAQQSRLLTLATGVSFLIPGTVVLILALMKPRTPKDSTASAASASAQAEARPAPVIAGCSLERPAQRLAETVFAPVPVLAASSGDKVAVGFATDKGDAAGLLVSPQDLSVTPAFVAQARGAILGVVPTPSSGPSAFAVDAPDRALAFARTVDAKVSFSIGVTAQGFSRRSGATMKVLWPGKSDRPAITTPRVAALPGTGYAVAFRHGGQSGKVLVGWLDENGDVKTELKAVPTSSALLGTPSLGVGPGGAAIAFAAKSSPSDPYGIEVSRVPVGGAPEPAKPFAIPPGGPGQEALSPSVEALPGGRFLLQWTEGATGNHAVRVQVLSADLVPSGNPITLSNADQNAGQGALWIGADRALALYLSKTEAASELWGALLKCP